MSRKAVFLDRDGVINQTIFRNGKARAPDHLHEFEFFPGVKEAVNLLKDAGYLTIVVTNQPDVARGWQTKEVVDSMNALVIRELGVDDLKVCFHDTGSGCECRKPRPGMLLTSAHEWDIDLALSYMIGDRMGDIEAGNSAGCTSILVGPGDHAYGQIRPAENVNSLLEAANWILKSG